MQTKPQSGYEHIKMLIAESQHLSQTQLVVQTLWQTIAENFYPERAQFTTTRHPGSEFADHLYSSLPPLLRRDLGNQFAGMLRRDKWFKIRMVGQDEDDVTAGAWLDYASDTMFNQMNRLGTGFRRATAEGDQDFAAFGQCVISVNWDYQTNKLIYRNWNLRDCAWTEDYTGKVATFYRKWKPTYGEVEQFFGRDALHSRMIESIDSKTGKGRHGEADIIHAIKPASEFNDPSLENFQWVSAFIDRQNNHMIEWKPMHRHTYVVPRWQTVSGSQYAFSPATIIGLPEARLIQDMAHTLLTAGQKAADPPLIATQEAVRSDVATYPGGITWLAEEYNEKLGEALRPLSIDRSGLPIGMTMNEQQVRILADCFYVSKLTLPVIPDATATEIRARVEEYIRNALPIFEPMETEYNHGLCDETFEVLMGAGVFGSEQDIPPELQGEEVDYAFNSPIRDAVAREDVIRFQEATELLALAVEFDPTAGADFDLSASFRDAIQGTGAKAEWLVDLDEAKEKRKMAQQLMAQQMAAEQGQQVAA